MTFSTLLTCLRIVLAGLILFLLFPAGVPARAGALAAFAVAGITDWLDGYLARRWHQTSALGALLDPIADKVLVMGILIVLALQRVVPPWMVIVMAAREIVITVVRLLAARKRVILAAAPEGKLKTITQMMSLSLFLVAGLYDAVAHANGWHSAPAKWLLEAGLILLGVAVALTLLSGVVFFRRNGKVLRAILRLR